ncbi:MAG: 3-isopropylmalate dehydratase large subunit [Francisellaceae bacterium]|jgi:3-isopropylmalate/(R)-2-methylmalate dehydratase large subunit|nr:3-isopropylmalate dehydratase large subunit [Francisellaceae bacterium]MBT6208020.1 3-isopropylmalate dehydratase large subunit [Francisellaceae bacterium]MBT6539687.1 3-isopropylmalate dehydratase large subunit [Francisellaceae bacterium]
MGRTLYDKLWDSHVVTKLNENDSLLYIDRHFLHEVTSPQAFDGLRINNRKVWRCNANIAVPDHNVPTTKARYKDDGSLSFAQVNALRENTKEFNVKLFDIADLRQGIVHVIGPELGLTLPGMTIVCGDSHTSTHGAFATIAMGVGTSEVEHVLATQCVIKNKLKNMKVECINHLPSMLSAKDLILKIIKEIGLAGGTGYAIEYCGTAITAMDMSARMTVCNMSIEAGAQCGLIAVDDTTIEYLKDLAYSPKDEEFLKASKYWLELKGDPNAIFDNEIVIDCSEISPHVTWGTSPDMTIEVTDDIPEANGNSEIKKALEYMGLDSGTKISDYELDHIFIGSCTNGRIEDLRIAANAIKGKKLARNIKSALVVPGSNLVKIQAEEEGLDEIFENAGFSWREPGCSMCLGMNSDKLSKYERCASTSNRNFEGRQGAGARTHLVSPVMAATAAIVGRIVDVREYLKDS